MPITEILFEENQSNSLKQLQLTLLENGKILTVSDEKDFNQKKK